MARNKEPRLAKSAEGVENLKLWLDGCTPKQLQAVLGVSSSTASRYLKNPGEIPEKYFERLSLQYSHGWDAGSWSFRALCAGEDSAATCLSFFDKAFPGEGEFGFAELADRPLPLGALGLLYAYCCLDDGDREKLLGVASTFLELSEKNGKADNVGAAEMLHSMLKPGGKAHYDLYDAALEPYLKDEEILALIMNPDDLVPDALAMLPDLDKRLLDAFAGCENEDRTRISRGEQTRRAHNRGLLFKAVLEAMKESEAVKNEEGVNVETPSDAEPSRE